MSGKNIFESSITPTNLEAGQKIKVRCKYNGTLLYGFFDLVIIIDEQYKLWFPDENTWNLWRDTGILKGAGKFQTEWSPFIQDWIPEGEYQAFTLLYDDKEGKNIDRKPLAEQKFKITISNSTHPDATFVRELYKRLLNRKPDIAGYRTWFVNLQIVKAERRQVLEIGFLRCPEFRARFIHKFFTGQNITSNELNLSVKVLINYPITILIQGKYQNFINDMGDFHAHVIEFLKMQENGRGFQELLKIEEKSSDPIEKLDAITNNFILEKYILIQQLYPDLSSNETEEKVEIYLNAPEKILNELCSSNGSN